MKTMTLKTKAILIFLGACAALLLAQSLGMAAGKFIVDKLTQ